MQKMQINHSISPEYWEIDEILKAYDNLQHDKKETTT